MKIINIIYPTPLKLCNIKNDNIDVFVKLENKKEYCVTVVTIKWIKEHMENGFYPAGTPDIIVSELKDNFIKNAIEDYSKEDAYWLKLYSISYGDEISIKEK